MSFVPSRTKSQMLRAGIPPQPPVVAKQKCGCCGVAKSLDQFELKDGGKRISRICDTCKGH